MESVALSIHGTTIFALVAIILYSDHLGLSWIQGKRETLPTKKMVLLHRLVWVGLAIMVASGVVLFLDLKDYLLTTPAFYVKMFFVATLVVNALFIGKFMRVATEKPFAVLSNNERLSLLISGAVSTISWIGAIIAAGQLDL